ncbi:hypothetical protein RHMOL_Rhmol09G0011800 [Rhododendron molle]|uniref:Uncharacterized protein n=1 Tax=Rhododendron molle TaxID=49168 RepID=A0ACC0M9R4_RHOML|nr:hypothetical protein RHMOL_Rhmol09G0011800 [Rhododendron molle]
MMAMKENMAAAKANECDDEGNDDEDNGEEGKDNGDGDDVEKGDMLLGELNMVGLGADGDDGWDRTSLGKSVVHFRQHFLRPLLKSCKESSVSLTGFLYSFGNLGCDSLNQMF